MLNDPLVSVLVPNYNHEKYLKNRLESIFKQTYQNIEVILMDDCSTDDSLKILNKYSKHQKVSGLFINDKNSGSPFKQWQKGFELAKGEWIWIAESDDYADNMFLEKLIQCNKLNDDALSVIYSQSIDVDGEGNFLQSRISYTSVFEPNIWKDDFEMKGDNFVKNYLSRYNVIPNASAVIFKKKLLKNIIVDDVMAKMKMCGDWLFWIKIINNSNVFFLAESLNYFRNHEKISRNHNDLKRKKRRLIEEKLVRDLLNFYGFRNPNEETNLYKEWIKLNSIKRFYSKNFTSIKLKRHTYLTFFKKIFFIKWKMLKR